MLEIQVAEIDAGAEQAAEGALQAVQVESGGRQQARFGDGEMGHGCDSFGSMMGWRRSGGDQPGGGSRTGLACAAGARLVTSTLGEAHGPVTR